MTNCLEEKKTHAKDYHTDTLCDNKVYQDEELLVKGANVGANQKIIRAYLENYLNGHLLFEGKQTIEELALFLYNQDFFFVRHFNGYKKLKYNSILRELRKSLREIKMKDEAEKKEKRKRIKEIKEERKKK